jgi:hypothetical protein
VKFQQRVSDACKKRLEIWCARGRKLQFWLQHPRARQCRWVLCGGALELYAHNKKPNLQGARRICCLLFISHTQRASAKNLFLARAERRIMLCAAVKKICRAILCDCGFLAGKCWAQVCGKNHCCMTYILENDPRSSK